MSFHSRSASSGWRSPLFQVAACLLIVGAGWGGASFAQSEFRTQRGRLESAARPATDVALRSTVSLRQGSRVVCQGLIVRANGWILTKSSELSPGMRVRLSSGREFPVVEVRDLGADDLALIRVEAEDLPVTPWAEASGLRAVRQVGSVLVNLGAGGAVRLGVVSHTTRRISREDGFLGVELSDFLGRGVRVESVVPGSAAARAGFRRGDLVIEFDGSEIRNRQSLSRAIRRSGSGARVPAVVRRSGERVESELVLGEREAAVGDDLRLWGPISMRRSGFSSVLQHDAKIRPEDCGGPVVDLEGRVVAINLARVDRVSSFALPADRVLDRVSRALAQ